MIWCILHVEWNILCSAVCYVNHHQDSPMRRPCLHWFNISIIAIHTTLLVTVYHKISAYLPGMQNIFFLHPQFSLYTLKENMFSSLILLKLEIKTKKKRLTRPFWKCPRANSRVSVNTHHVGNFELNSLHIWLLHFDVKHRL